MKLYTLLAFLGILILSHGCKDNDTSSAEEPVEKTYPIAHVHTRVGDMYFWLYDQTPVHKAKFIELAEAGHYDQFTVNRVVRNFVIQGGCPDSPSYFENSPYLLDPEFVDTIGHSYGALGMGRDNNPEKRSNACQFYVVCKEQGLPGLDGNYMIFGHIIKGEDVLEAIEIEKTDDTDTPLEDIPLSVSIKQYTARYLSDSLGFDVPGL